MATLTYPTVVTEFARTADPLDALSTIAWTDISTYVRSISTKAGRQHELGQFAAGTATIILDNPDRRFDPAYSGGAYGSDVKPMKRVRVRAHRGAALDYDGVNDYAEAAHHASIAITGDMTVEWWGYYDSFAAKRTAVAMTVTSGGVQAAPYDFRVIETGAVSARVGNGAATQALDSTRLLSTGNWYHIAVTISGTTLTHYVNGIPEASQTITQARADGGGTLRVGIRNDASNPMDGRLDEIRIWNVARSAGQIRGYMNKELDGTETGLVAYWKFDEGTGTTVDDTSSNSNTLTLGASTAAPTWVTGSSTRPYYLFTGYAEAWNPKWDGIAESTTELKCVDAIKVLNLTRPSRTMYSSEVLGDSPYLYWRLGETVGTTIVDSSGNARSGTISGAVALGKDPLLTNDPNPSVQLAAGAYVDGGAVASFERTQAFSVAAWFLFPDADTGTSQFVGKFDYAAVRGWALRTFGNNFVRLTLMNTNTTNGADVHAQVLIVDGKRHLVVATYDGSSTAAGIKLYLDGVLLTMATLQDNLSATIITAENFKVGKNINVQAQDVSVYTSVLSATQVADMYEAGATPWAGDWSGERADHLLDVAQWPTADRSIDRGVATYAQQDEIGSILSELQAVGESELGGFFFLPDGRARLAGRYSNITDSAVWKTWGDSGTELDYLALSPNYDDTDLWNEIHATRPDGVTQVTRDATSVGDYGLRVMNRDGLWADDNQAQAVSEKLLDRYDTPKLRFPSLKTTLVSDADFVAVLGTDLHNERITVKRRPPENGVPGTVVSQDCWVESIAHQIQDLNWTTTFGLVPADTAASYATVGVSTVGDGALLAY